MEIIDCYKEIANNIIYAYGANEDIEGGINGPYDDPETPIRNLSHLAVIVSIETVKYKKTELYELCNRIGSKILSMTEDGTLYRLRMKAGKDVCNGVIGHAWVIEGLIYLYVATNNEEYLNAAKEIEKRHTFNKVEHLWHKPKYESFKSDCTIDYTLNHQLWFAASCAELYKITLDSHYKENVVKFLDNLHRSMWIHRSGLICHPIYNKKGLAKKVKGIGKFGVDCGRRIINLPNFRYREEGYHVFNVMALARIKAVFPDHGFFKRKKAIKAVEYLKSPQFYNGINSDKWVSDPTLNLSQFSENEVMHNVYAYPYNVTGFELMYISRIYSEFDLEEIALKGLYEQHLYTYDAEKKCIQNECHDKITPNYRIYELYRYLELL